MWIADFSGHTQLEDRQNVIVTKYSLLFVAFEPVTTVVVEGDDFLFLSHNSGVANPPTAPPAIAETPSAATQHPEYPKMFPQIVSHSSARS